MLNQITSALVLAQVSSMNVNDIPSYNLVGIESDPICSSAGCTQYNHPRPSLAGRYPKDYFVPNFGRDADVIGTINSEQVASK